MNKCVECGREYVYDKKKGHTLTKCGTCYIAGNRKRKKEFAVKLFGGKCQKCGYDRCIHSLAFHHVENKENNISILHTASWKRYLDELKKCVLICCNCHNELHGNLWKIDEIQRVYISDEVYKIKIPTGRTDRVFNETYNKECAVCRKPFTTKIKHQKYCNYKCAGYAGRKCHWPSKEQLQSDIKSMPMTHVGKKYKVTDNTIRKWARCYGIL